MGKVRFVNQITGTEMWVADERVEEYKGLGFFPASDSDTAIEPAPEPEKKVVRKTATAKKTTKKK